MSIRPFETASPRQRFFAFVIDTTVFVSFFFLVGRLLWMIVPQTETRVGIMSDYSEYEQRVYLATVAIGIAAGIGYFVFLPVSRMQSTIGQRLFGLRVIAASGSPLTVGNIFRRLLVLTLKVSLVFLGGPLAAFAYRNDVVAFILLFFPTGFLIVSAFIAWSRPDGRWLWEWLGGYRFVSTRPPIDGAGEHAKQATDD